MAKRDLPPAIEGRMNVHFSYKAAKTPDLEQHINQQIEKLRKRLQIYRPELVHLHGNVDQNSPREGFHISLNLRLPSGQLAAQSSAPTAVAAIKGGFEDLVEQLTKHKDMLRSQHKWPRRRREGRERPEAQVPFEQTVAAVQPPTISGDDVYTWVNANLVRLERFVDRELRYRESNGQLQPEQLSQEEVVDEAIATAMGNGIEKPERVALEPWLYRLAMRAIDLLAAREMPDESNVSLDQPTRRPNVSGSDEPHLQFHQADESFTAETTIADRRVATPEDAAYSDEMVRMVEVALVGAKPDDREAFLLYAVEGFTPEEISVITDKPVDQVRSSVSSAREHLRKALPVPDPFKDKLLQHSRIA